MSKIDPTEKTKLSSMLADPVMIKAMHLALAEVGEKIDDTNTMSQERSAMAYQAQYGARSVIRVMHSYAGIEKNPQITPRKLQHR